MQLEWAAMQSPSGMEGAQPPGLQAAGEAGGCVQREGEQGSVDGVQMRQLGFLPDTSFLETDRKQETLKTFKRGTGRGRRLYLVAGGWRQGGGKESVL